jgi:hypothetical protein
VIGGWDEGLWAVVPTICVGLLFWFVMRAILHADRNERAAQARYEAELDAQLLAGTVKDPSGERPASDQGD